MLRISSLAVVVSFIAGPAWCDDAKPDFRGFPEIGKYRPGKRSAERFTSDGVDIGLVRPKWTRAMGDLGGWPTLFRFKDGIFFFYPHADAHRGKKEEATGQILGYVSRDEGRTWQALPPQAGTHVGEFVVVGDTVFCYDFDSRIVTHVRTSTDCITWSERKPITGLDEYLWLWGVMYDAKTRTFYAPPHMIPKVEDPNKRQIQLVKSTDGFNWEKVSTIHSAATESESCLRFEPDGTIVVLIRKKYDYISFTAVAKPPYQQWDVTTQKLDLGGEHFYEIGGKTFVGTRAAYTRGFNQPKGWTPDPEVKLAARKLGTRTDFAIIHRFDENRILQPWAIMDSMGDCSYPHLVETPTEILCAYYSQHEDGISKAFLCAFDKQAFLAGPVRK